MSKKLSEQHKINIGKGMIGKNKGHKHSENTKIKIGLSRQKYKGKNAPNYKGGITVLGELIRTSFKYRQWRSDVFTGQDFTCQDCGIRGGDLEAHHIKSFSDIIKENNIKTLEQALNCEELWNINNGQTLCKNCHDKTKVGRRLSH